MKTTKGEETKQRILSCALALFRARGFEATTMREVAAEAGLSLGAAYHYFDSKEAIVLGYYDSVQTAHDQAVRAMLPETRGLRDRIGAAMHAKFDILEDAEQGRRPRAGEAEPDGEDDGDGAGG